MNKKEFDELIESLEEDAIATIRQCMRERGPHALKAAELLLAYSKGKPVQTIEGSGGGVLVNPIINITYAKPAPPAVPDARAGLLAEQGAIIIDHTEH